MIGLLSHIGVCSGEPVIRQFLEHYYRLGVDRFLLVLHAEQGDERRERVYAALRDYDVEPALVVTEFNTRLKRERFVALIETHCRDEDWVLYADVDEFHVYPEPLHALLRRCDAEPYSFVRGRLIDRVGVEGRLEAIRSDRPLWSQFPWTAPATAQVRQGWDGKVCAARAGLRLGEGGFHTLDYGRTSGENYARTWEDPLGLPEPIEVHHFRWDDSLLQRTRDKIAAAGGDTDAIDDPVVIREYRRILAHLEQHGRIELPGMGPAPPPQPCYERTGKLDFG